MSKRDFVAIVVSSQSKAYGGSCVESVYLVETTGPTPVEAAETIFARRFGNLSASKEVEYEIVTGLPEIIARSDVTWLTRQPHERMSASEEFDDGQSRDPSGRSRDGREDPSAPHSRPHRRSSISSLETRSFRAGRKALPAVDIFERKR